MTAGLPPQIDAEPLESAGRTDDSGALPDPAQEALEWLRLSRCCRQHQTLVFFCEHRH